MGASKPGREPLLRTQSRAALLVLIGFASLQLGWLLTIPPAGGVDEFDHVYRSVAVASGDWVAPPGDATRGTGAELTVPAHIVEATKEECLRLPYTVPRDCLGVPVGDDEVRVPSGAGRYNPVYYAVVGIPSLWLDGAAAIYGMRVVSMVLCASLLWLAFRAVRHLRPNRWLPLAMVIGVSPTVAYGSIVIAPNAVEIMAGLLLWVSWSAILRGGIPQRPGLLALLLLSASILVTTRSLGPLWCLLILLAGLVSTKQPLVTAWSHLRSPRGAAVAAIGLVVTIAGVAWTLANGSLEIGHEAPEDDSVGTRLRMIAKSLLLWTLQVVGAFPSRTDPAPPVVYAVVLLMWVGLLVLALRRGDIRTRTALVVVIAIAYAVPAAITWVTFETFYLTWQGRYTLPFSIGIAVLAGIVLSETRPRVLSYPPMAVGIALAYAFAHTAGPFNLYFLELDTSPGVDNGNWLVAPPAVIAVLCFGGALVMAWTAWRWPTAADEASADVRADEGEALQDRRVSAPPELTPGGRRGVGQ